MTTEDEDVPLAALYDIFLKLNKRMRIMELLSTLSIPSVVFAISLFLVIASASAATLSSVNALIFGFFTFSAVSTFLGTIIIPNTLSEAIRRMQVTAQNISLSIAQPTGDTPEKRIFNQLLRSDFYVRDVVKNRKGSVFLKTPVEGKSGKSYLFDVYIRNRNRIGKYFNVYSDMYVFVKRFDQATLVNLETIKGIKEAVKDILSLEKRAVPSRVLIVSTSGFEENVFGYVKSKEGKFRSIFGLYCYIDLLREKPNGYFEILD